MLLLITVKSIEEHIHRNVYLEIIFILNEYLVCWKNGAETHKLSADRLTSKMRLKQNDFDFHDKCEMIVELQNWNASFVVLVLDAAFSFSHSI